MWGSGSNRELKIGMGWEGLGCPVIVRGTTQEYRRVLAQVVMPNDVCVEIGSAAGITTLQMAKTCTQVVIGVDASPGEVEGAIANAAKQRRGKRRTTRITSSSTTTTTTSDNDNDDDDDVADVVSFVVAQVRAGADDTECEASLAPLVEVLARTGHTLCHVTVLAIDVAGTAPLECITPLIVSLRRLMKPRVTVVKSLTLKKLLVAVEAGEALLGKRRGGGGIE